MEALVCPDGSTIGREGPNCEFPECPADHRFSVIAVMSGVVVVVGGAMFVYIFRKRRLVII